MSYSICNKKGITLIEVLVSALLISVGVLALLTMLPSGWRLTGTSDLLGRAAAILQGEMERNEILIMNQNNAVAQTPPGAPETRTVYGSGGTTAQRGDIPYFVQTERVDLGPTWRVRVQVTWPGNAAGIRESLLVSRQRTFAQQ
jgi:Tfp pilus assembly protein PilV